MKLGDIPPFIRLVSSDDQEDDDCSQLTGPCEGDQASQNEEGDFARIMAMMDPSQFDPPSLSGNDDLIRVNTALLNAYEENREKSRKREKLEEKQGLLDLRLQVAKQTKMLKRLSAKLNKSQLEVQALKVEKASLIDALAQARERGEESAPPSRERGAESAAPPSSSHGRFSFRGGSAAPPAPPAGVGGSMQMLLNTNARLRADNDRLRASLEGASASLRSHIHVGSGHRGADRRAEEEDVEKLRRENTALRRRMTCSARKGSVGSEDTAKTSMTSGAMSDENQDQDVANSNLVSLPPSTKQDCMETTFFCSTFDFSGGEEYLEGKEIKDEHAGTGGKEMNTAGDKVTTCKESEGLLVDFVEGRRSRGATRWWPDLRAF